MPLNPQEKYPVLNVQESGWAPLSDWLGAEILAPIGIRSLDFPARSESLYRLRYPGPCRPLIPSLIETHLPIWNNTQCIMVLHSVYFS